MRTKFTAYFHISHCQLTLSTESDKSNLVVLLFQISFGAPRTGNSAFAQALERRSAVHCVRVVNDGDIVPRVPPPFWPFSYRHAGEFMRLQVIHPLGRAPHGVPFL